MDIHNSRLAILAFLSVSQLTFASATKDPNDTKAGWVNESSSQAPPSEADLEFSSAERLAFSQPPEEKQTIYEYWNENLFIHFAMDPEEVQKALPPSLVVDTYPDATGQMKAWVTVWGFRQEKTHPVWMPRFMGSTFPDLHIQTPVRNIQGTEFSHYCFRIWANNHFGAWVGRKFFHAPMFFAKQKIVDLAGTEIQGDGFGGTKVWTSRIPKPSHLFHAEWKVGEKLPYDAENAHTFLGFLHNRFQQVTWFDGVLGKVRHTKPMWELYRAHLSRLEIQLEGLPFQLPASPTYVTYGKKMTVRVFKTHKVVQTESD